MKHCESLLMLVCITLLPAASEALSVTGHLGDDVVLPCRNDNPDITISQVQWDFMSPEGNHSYRIIVFNSHCGVNISESPLRDRVDINEHSLMIKNVKVTDAGIYSCRTAAFPTGSFERWTNLIVEAASEALSVTGHLGDDVVLPCQNDNPDITISQVLWDFMSPEWNHSYRIIVFSPRFGVNISESPLRDRVDINEHSLMIKNVKVTDAGIYTCRTVAFPTGSFQRRTNLIVEDQSFQLLSALAYATVAAMLLLGILAAIAYLTALRCGSSLRRYVNTNTSSTVMDASTREDVIYTKVKVKTSRGSTTSPSHADAKTTSDDETYAEVVF